MEHQQRSSKPSNEIFYALQKLEEILHQKELQISLLELDVFSPLKNLLVVKNSKDNANSNKLKVEAVEISGDFTGAEAAMKEEKTPQMHRVSNGRKLLTDSRASSSNEVAKMSLVSPSRGKVYVNSCEGEQILQGIEIEQLKARLEFLEEESKLMRLEFLDHVEEKKKMVNEIFQQFQTIYHYLELENSVDGEKGFRGSLTGLPPEEVGTVTSRDQKRRDVLTLKEAPEE
ncbi:hypothetical protein JCGZ_06099 [Jatropha curcas]|uniref:Uncharacterized protein n=2 Tax=Jatropha curcas TaxID=180498 RepID=A0A067KPU7_JATCU|nr:hypothetical protein JCGZ_06099 [Jatropha curcas]